MRILYGSAQHIKNMHAKNGLCTDLYFTIPHYNPVGTAYDSIFCFIICDTTK